jgi:hypothetical protein
VRAFNGFLQYYRATIEFCFGGQQLVAGQQSVALMSPLVVSVLLSIEDSGLLTIRYTIPNGFIALLSRALLIFNIPNSILLKYSEQRSETSAQIQ